MTNAQETWLWIGTGGMALGAVAIAATGRSLREDERHHAVASFFVCLIAACAYFAMANGQGIVGVAGREVYVPRYADWLLTTPLLLLGLAMVALPKVAPGGDTRERTALIAGLLGADALMIVTGLLASLSSDDTVRYVWYTISCGAFLAVLALLYGPVLKAAGASAGHQALAGRLARVLTGLWFIYPVLWLLGTEGSGTIGLSTEIAVFAVIDLSAKVGFGLLLVSGARRLGEPATVQGDATDRLRPATRQVA